MHRHARGDALRMHGTRMDRLGKLLVQRVVQLAYPQHEVVAAGRADLVASAAVHTGPHPHAAAGPIDSAGLVGGPRLSVRIAAHRSAVAAVCFAW